MMKHTFAFFDPYNQRFSNEFLFRQTSAEWFSDYDQFIRCSSNNRYYYLWEHTVRGDLDCLEKIDQTVKDNKVKIFLDLSSGEISTKHYHILVNKIINYGVENFVIHLNTQFEFDTLNAMFGGNKPLIFFSNRNEIHFYENLVTSLRPKRFLFLSRRFSIQRLFIFLDLHKRGILENSHYTFGTYETVYGVPNYTVYSTDKILTDFSNRISKFIDDPYVKSIYDYANDNKHIFNTLPKFIGNFGNQNPSQIANLFNESYISLLPESKLGDDDKIYQPSEKLMKCFYYKHPFLVYSSPNFLKYTKLSGYKTFNAFDESYDQVIPYINRIKMINDFAEKINKLDNIKFINLYNECLPNILHNHEVLTSKMQNYFANYSYNHPDPSLAELFKGRIKFDELR